MIGSSPPVLLVLLFAAWSSVLLPQERTFFVAASSTSNKNKQDGSVPTNEKDIMLFPSASVPAEEQGHVPTKGGSLEKFNLKEPTTVGTMTIHERVDAAEYLYEEFKRAVEELSQVDATDFPELEELLHESIKAIESMSEPIADSIHFLRLTAATDTSNNGDEDGAAVLLTNKEVDQNNALSSENTTSMLPERPQVLFSPPVSKKHGSESTATHRFAGRRATQTEAGRDVGGEKKKKPTKRNNLHGSSSDHINFNPFTSTQDDLLKGGDHTTLMKKFIKSLQCQQERPTDQTLSDLFRNPLEQYEDGDSDMGHHRRLKTKNEKCEQLAECASRMSLFDLFVLYHSDDIDPVTGVVDENVVLFDEGDILAKKARIDSLATQILQQGETTLCDDLLEEFHRTVEFDGIPQWEGSTISQVCLAEGTTVFVNLASLYVALAPDAFPEDPVLEELFGDLDTAIQQFMLGGATNEQLTRIRNAHLDAILLPRRKEAFDLVNGLAEETVTCAGQLFDSSDRSGDPIFENESFIFSTPDLSALMMSPLYGGDGGTPFDESDVSTTFIKLSSVEVYYTSNFVVNGLLVRHETLTGEHAFLHGSQTGDSALVSFPNDAFLVEMNLRTGDKVDQITFIDSNGVVSGPFGGSGGLPQPPIKGHKRRAIFTFYGRASSHLFSLGVHFQDKMISSDFSSTPALTYQIPNGLSTGLGGRSPHGQLIMDGVSPFTFTSSSELLRQYAACLEDQVESIEGLVQVFENVQQIVQNGEGFTPCDNDPQNPSLICSELHAVGLLPIEDENPFMCGSDAAWVSYDGTFCCSAAVCDREECGSHCPNDNTNFGSASFMQQENERKLCCEADIRRNAFECTDSKQVGCKIKEGNRWYDIAIREAREQFLTETAESEKTCASDYFEAVQHGLGLVFGERRSTPGYVCGIKSAVVDKGKNLPGTCCLDAPFELSDENWGSNYECSMTCQNLAPYFSGMSEETCDVYGGTWCPQPTDCTTLQTCIDNLLVTTQSESRLQAFVMYLSAAPNITDPADYNQCGDTREYFGFDPDFINDAQICDDVEQLRFSRDFTFLEDFLGVGSNDLTPPGDIEIPEVPEPPEDGEPEDVPPLELTPPDRTATQSTPVQNGQAWRSTNFALKNLLIKGRTLLRLIADFSCLLDFKFIKANICLKIRNILIAKQSTLVKLANLSLEISEFTYGELAEIDNVGQLAILENSDAIFGNMELMATYLQERFMALNWYIETETDTIKEILDGQNDFLVTTLETKTDFLTGLLGLLLDHFDIPFQSRKLEGGAAGGTNDDETPSSSNGHHHQQYHAHQEDEQDTEEELHNVRRRSMDSSTTSAKDHHHSSCQEQERDGQGVASHLLHKVQIEITSSTEPRSFACGVLRHKDAGGVSPKLLRLEVLDIVTRTKTPVMLYEVDDLGGGVLLVTIPAIDDNENGPSLIDGVVSSSTYFATIGLTEDGSEKAEVVAEHSLMVSFPSPSAAVQLK